MKAFLSLVIIVFASVSMAENYFFSSTNVPTANYMFSSVNSNSAVSPKPYDYVEVSTGITARVVGSLSAGELTVISNVVSAYGAPRPVSASIMTNRLLFVGALSWPINETNAPFLGLQTNANGRIKVLSFDDAQLEWAGAIDFIIPDEFDASIDVKFVTHGFGTVTGTVANVYRYRFNGVVAWTTVTGSTYSAVGTLTSFTLHTDSFDINPSDGDFFQLQWARQTTNIAGTIAGDWYAASLYVEWFEQ